MLHGRDGEREKLTNRNKICLLEMNFTLFVKTLKSMWLQAEEERVTNLYTLQITNSNKKYF